LDSTGTYLQAVSIHPDVVVDQTPNDIDILQARTLVEALVQAVDGSFEKANESVQALVKAKVTLLGDDINAVLAAFLILHDNELCLRVYGQDHGHEYFTKFGAVVPKYSKNQLHAGGLGLNFYYGCCQYFQDPDAKLFELFCKFFFIAEGISSATGGFDRIMGSQQPWVAQLKGEIFRRRLVVMTGIGVSLGLVNDRKLTWDGLLDAMREMLNQRINNAIPVSQWTGTPEEKAQLLKDTVSVRIPYLDYRQFVSIIMTEIPYPGPNPERRANFANSIRNLHLPIATTNYDLLLEQSLRRFDANLSKVPVRMSSAYHHEFVYHVHGVWFDSDSVVLSDLEYEKTQYSFEYAIGKLFFDSTGCDQHRSLLFIGCKDGIVDAHFSTLFVDPRFSHLQHFALLKEEDIRYLIGVPAFNRAVSSGRLVPICYGQHHEELEPFLRSLAP
jgi:hypothetical protein